MTAEKGPEDAIRNSNALIGFYPAAVGSEEKPSPSGTLKVTEVSRNPTYRYNPDYHFKGVRSDKPFTIKPGPNNPVGTVWISLSAEGYGIHGTPEPGKVSKAESHCCVRLTNWDAERVAGRFRKARPWNSPPTVAEVWQAYRERSRQPRRERRRGGERRTLAEPRVNSNA